VVPEEKDTRAKKEFQRRLDLHLWLYAWDAYALAGVALGQFEYARAVRHKAVVFEVALHASSGQRNTLLGALYDELARHSG